MSKNTFTIEQKELLALLASMQPICNKKTTLSITEAILFHITTRELTLKATDLEISLQASCPLEKNTIDDITFLVSGKRIFELVKELDDEIEFSIENNQLKLKSGGVDLALNIRDAEDFPPFPERIENMLQMEAPFMLSLLSKVSFLIPQNNANVALNGMLLEISQEGMAMVATDGHCLAQVKTDKCTLDERQTWLLPKKAVVEIRKILENSQSKDLFVGTCGSQLVFSGSNFNFFTKLLAEPFPQYQSILNKDGFISATIARGDIVKTLKRAGCLLAGQFISAEFSFTPGKLDVALRNKEVGKLEESLGLGNFEGATIESRFYSPYLLSGLSVFPDSEVSFYVKNTNKPIIFESNQDMYQFTYLVMPVSAT